MSSSVRLLPAVLALVMVGAGLLVLPQPSVAQGLDPDLCDKPAGSPTLTMTPNGSQINSRQSNSQRIILVKNNDATQNVVTVTFTFEVPTGSRERVLFVYGSKPGWDVRWQNSLDDPANPDDGYTITFRSTDPSKFYLAPGEEEPFTIYITIVSGSVIMGLKVTGTFANGGPGTGAYYYCLVPDTAPPTPIWAMAFDRTGLPPFQDQPNGRLDQIEVAWSEPIDPSTFRVQDFRIFPPGQEQNPYKIVNYEFLSDQTTQDFRPIFVEESDNPPLGSPEAPIPLDPTNGVLDCLGVGEDGTALDPRCTRIRFYLAEKSGFDSGVMPNLRYTPGTLRDMAGNLVRSTRVPGAVEMLDMARPVIVGALAYSNGFQIEAQGQQTYEEIVVTFSEEVVSNRQENQETCDVDNILVGDLRYVDGENGPASERGRQGNLASDPLTPDNDGEGFNDRNNPKGRVFHPYNPKAYAEDQSAACGGTDGHYNQALFRVRLPSVPGGPNDNVPLVDTSVAGDPVKFAWGDVPRDPSYTFQEPSAANCLPNPAPCAKPFGDMVCYTGGFDDKFRNNSSNRVPDGQDDDAAHELEYKIRERGTGVNGQGRFLLQAYGLDNTDGQFIFPACRRVHLPDTIMTMVDIDSNVAVLQFTGPMSDRTSDASPIRPEDIDVVPTTVDKGCPQAQVGVSHSAGSDLAFVTMDVWACPTDVDDTPSFLRVAPARVRPTGAAFRIPGALDDLRQRPDPPQYPPAGEDGMGFVPTKDVEMWDLVGPRIVKAHTVDQDGNGAIDGMFVEFNERVDDASFCASNLNGCRGPASGGMLLMHMRPEEIPPDACVSLNDVNTPIPPDSLSCVDLGARSGIEPVSCYTTRPGEEEAYFWETDLFANDRFGIIKWRVANPYAGGTECVTPSPEYDPEIVRVRVAKGDAEQRDANPAANSGPLDLPFVPHQTGIIPDLATVPGVGINLFRDYSIRNVLPPSNPIGLRNRNGMDWIRSYEIHEEDGAPAAILKAETKDFFGVLGVSSCKPITLPDNPTPPPCRDNGDGYLDTYRLTLSEKVSDASFIAANWTVGGRPVSKLTTGNLETDVANDHIVHVEFNRGPQPDTGDLPQLLHDRAGKEVTVRDQRKTDVGFRDLHNIPMNDVSATDVVEVDAARPVLMRVEGKAGENTLKLTFSEPVDDGSAGPLVRADLTYSNRFNPKPNKDGSVPPSASGPSSNIEVQHQAAQRTALLTLNGPIHEDELDQDLISARYDPANGPYDPKCPYEQDQFADAVCVPQCPQMARNIAAPGDPPEYQCLSARYLGPTGYVFESQPNLPKELRQPALNYLRPLTLAPDEVPPGKVTDLFLDRVTANSVRLSWTAPGDDGAAGTVTNYTVKVSTTPIIRDDGTDAFDAVVNPEDLEIVLEASFEEGEQPPAGAIVAGGETQVMLISGLRPRTPYYFALRANDEVGNAGPVSNQQSAETLQDITPPVGTVTIKSSTHKVNVPTMETRARFEWTEATDPEGTVEYHYRVTDRQDYSVVVGDSKTTIPNAQVEIPAEGTWYFHVRAFSGAGPQATTSHFGPIVIGHAVVDIADIDAANLALMEHTYANETRSGGVNIEWVVPEDSDLPTTEIEAIEIWRLDDGAWKRIHREPGDLSTLRSGNFTDQQGREGDRYLVTYVFAGDQRQANPDTADYTGVKVKALGDRNVPEWVFLLLGVCLALILAGIIIFFVLRRRSRQELEQSAIPYAWENAAGPQTGIDQATGLPTHDVTCPNCSTVFQAVGEFPLAVTCPSCGASGTLD